ncbi:hypothetical protein [Spiroplasma endosymbiont of Nebria brevicollis]|uniref:hypothetical protein n=1 Tax=Spiroplasma endosymbiont of Nebria brevicollis TaxID=3066284 RepID=UPI00313DAA89
MQSLTNCGIYFANVPLTKTTNETRCENANCNYQYCIGCILEPVIIWTQTPDKKCLVIPIIKTSVEHHEQNLGSIGDNLALINLKKSSNNAILNFLEDNVCYANLNRLTWIKNFRIGAQYLIDVQLRVLNETEIHDLSFRVRTLPVSSVSVISNIGLNKNLNLNNQIINSSSVAVAYNGDNMKD